MDKDKRHLRSVPGPQSPDVEIIDAPPAVEYLDDVDAVPPAPLPAPPRSVADAAGLISRGVTRPQMVGFGQLTPVQHGLYLGGSALIGGALGAITSRDMRGTAIGALSSMSVQALVMSFRGVVVYGPTRVVYTLVGVAAGAGAGYLSWRR